MNQGITRLEEEKTDQIIQYIKPFVEDGIVVAFSGGVDSCVLLKAACIAAALSEKTVLAVTFMTKLHPMGDTQEAVDLAEEMGAVSKVIVIDEFADSEITKNPIDRCYLCKKLLFQTLLNYAAEKGYGAVFDGTNYSDTKEYRPGLKALEELGIKSPLKELGYTKSDVRAIASFLGLKTASKPSTPCMATRLPYGDHFDYELLNRIHEGEEWLRKQGFYNVRLRYHKPVLRLEVDISEFEKLIKLREELINYLKGQGFIYITLDLEGFRSGSMDIFRDNFLGTVPEEA